MTEPCIKLSLPAADGIADRMAFLEIENAQLRKEVSAANGRVEMLDRANELMARELETARKARDAFQAQVHNLTRKLAAYHESQRTPEQNESLADTLEQHRAWGENER